MCDACAKSFAEHLTKHALTHRPRLPQKLTTTQDLLILTTQDLCESNNVSKIVEIVIGGGKRMN